MKIQFCDLCNESVPEGDFAAGKAFMRQGRVVCATCEALMSHAESASGNAARPVPVTLASAPGAASFSTAGASATATGRDDGRPKQESQSAGWIAVLALVAAGGSAWYFSGELSKSRIEQDRLRGELRNDLVHMGSDLDQISMRAQQRESELEARVRTSFNARDSDLETSLAELRQELRAAKDNQNRIESELALIGEAQKEGSIESGRRLDDLLAQSMKSRQNVETLATRLDQVEVSAANRVAAANLQVTPPSGPKYAAEMADLLSDTAGTRWNAVQSLGETGDPEVVPHLVPLLKDSDVFVRMAVARVCGDLASPVAVDPLIDALEDEEPVVREAAMAALQIITGREFRFDPNGKPPERAKRVKAWRDWWSKAKSDFF